MKELFNLENPVWAFMGKLVDMLILSVLWVLCSLPIVTIGASTAALYYVALKLAENQEGYTISSFFQAFRTNLKQGAAAGVIAEVLALMLAADFYICHQMENNLGIMIFWGLVVITAVYLMIVVHLFPLMARCDTDLKHLVAMAFVIAVKNFGWTLFMVVSAVFFWVAGLFWMAPLLVIVPGAIAYLHSKILNMVWKEYGLVIQ